MILYVLLHYRLPEPGRQIGSCKALGVFTALERAKRGLDATAAKPGFRDGGGTYQVIALVLDQETIPSIGLGRESGAEDAVVVTGDSVVLVWRRVGGDEMDPVFLPCGVFSDVESARRSLPWGDDQPELGGVVADVAEVDRVEWALGFGDLGSPRTV